MSSTSPPPTPLTRNQLRGFWAAWGGWTLDGMDSFIYALVMLPALNDLLPRSGIANDVANRSYYGSLLFALFLVGWGMAFLWGPVADKFGRVRTLMLTILWYSVFTFAGAFATGIWQLAAYRFLAGIGIGGEWAMGGTFVAEEWPEDRREWGASLMHTGYYVGVLLAAVLNYLIAARYGWRAMFLVGGTPALLVALIRYGVTEPKRWQNKGDQFRRLSFRKPLAMLFSPEFRRRTVLNCTYVFISIVGLWAGSVYLPSWVGMLFAPRIDNYFPTAQETAAAVARGIRLGSIATMIASIATIVGCLLAAPLARRFGRRAALAFFFALMVVSIIVVFYVAWVDPFSFLWLSLWIAVLGVGGASFAVYTLWLPEQYPTECRASAFALATSIGRFGGAGITFLVGMLAARLHNLGFAVALTALAFLLGLTLVPFGHETRGKSLPA
jgi:MFS family permease